MYLCRVGVRALACDRLGQPLGTSGLQVAFPSYETQEKAQSLHVAKPPKALLRPYSPRASGGSPGSATAANDGPDGEDPRGGEAGGIKDDRDRHGVPTAKIVDARWARVEGFESARAALDESRAKNWFALVRTRHPRIQMILAHLPCLLAPCRKLSVPEVFTVHLASDALTTATWIVDSRAGGDNSSTLSVALPPRR